MKKETRMRKESDRTNKKTQDETNWKTKKDHEDTILERADNTEDEEDEDDDTINKKRESVEMLQVMTHHTLEPRLGKEAMSGLLLVAATTTVEYNDLICDLADDIRVINNIYCRIAGALGNGSRPKEGTIKATAKDLEELMNCEALYAELADVHDLITKKGVFSQDKRTVHVKKQGELVASDEAQIQSFVWRVPGRGFFFCKSPLEP